MSLYSESALINSISMDRMGDKSIETYSDQLSVTLRTNKWRVTINLTTTGKSAVNLASIKIDRLYWLVAHEKVKKKAAT